MINKIKVWIIDDEAIIAQNLRFTLEDLGYEVVGQSYDYASGLSAIANEDFDLLILDINLSEKKTEHNGLALASMLKKYKKIPFMFLTAYNDKDTISQAATLKPSGYIIKPANAATIFAAMQIAIENYNENKQATPQTAHIEKNIPDFFFSKIGSKLHKVYWKDVAKLEAIKNYVSIKTFNDNSEYLIRGSLVQILQNMMPTNLQKQFFRINRAVYLQKSAILAIYTDSVLSPFGEINTTEENIVKISNIAQLNC